MNNIKTDESSEGLAHVSKLLKLMTLESSLAFIVLLLTSILTHLSPEG
jgi:putative copper export protein